MIPQQCRLPGPSKLWRRKPTKGLGGKEPNMLIIGCDYHPGFQQIAFVDKETGELGECRLAHREQAEQFYRELKQRNVAVRVGMESSGHSRWFERLLRELQFELWIGDAAEIRTKRVRKQKTESTGRAVVITADDGRPLSANLGARCGESRSAATAVASASAGADAHAGDEPVACGSAQRRSATQEGVVASRRPQGIGVDRIGSVGHASTARLARLTRPTDAEDPGTDACSGRGSGEASGDAALDDASRSWSADGAGVRAGDWNSRTLSLRETDYKLCRSGSDGRVQRRPAPIGSHQ